MSQSAVSASELSGMLAAQVVQLVAELLPGGVRQGQEWVCGSVGGEKGSSLAVHIGGGKAGVWADFSTGECGDALDLVAAVMTAGDAKAAYRWAHRWLGLGDIGAVEERRAQVIAQKSEQPDDDDEKGRRAARAMWLAARPDIIGTPVDFYLRARKIGLSDLPRLPRALRFAPDHWCREAERRMPAMLAAIVDLDGQHIATHQTWLAQIDGVWRKAPLEIPKKVRGRFVGGTIRLARGATSKALREVSEDELVAVGEGIETCLSVALGCPELRVLAAVSLSNMASVGLPDRAKRLLLLADNDDKPEAKRGLRRAIDSHLAIGREVRVARSPRGKDFNDALT